MCLGGGGDQYNARKSGDYGRWESGFKSNADLQAKLARGEITQAQYDAQAQNLADLESQIKQDPSANMDMREAVRQNDVGLGRIGIDKNFSKFGDNYYNDFKSKYQANYNPQLDRQYKEVTGKTTAALAERGVLASSTAGNKYADLARQQADARGNIANEAQDASNKLRGSVENAKTNLYNLNEAAADPKAINAQAVGAATSLVAPPAYSPLGQVFADTLASLANFQSARSNSPGRSYRSPYSAASGAGSSRVIG